ncbi:HAD-IC family P-type ATPase [Marinobacter sp. F4216]|uniref:HAD-IC family P-type ATPase n=1 Tax=Marinobacter sp. F4216 TaxID=2874281 RepID=UPI001CBC2D0D|nr:HAD-IC family P-type ATPase [Marinobacter sp. F4216]MBZ2167505.1 HAD-IC family P-type ATPase [Marinobacter sp. F4216]
MEQGTGFHQQDTDTVFRALTTGRAGLSQAEARERLARFGSNRLPEARRQSPLIRFLRQFHNILIYVLLAAASITLLLGHGLDTAVILAVVLLNAVVGYVQEGKAARAIAAIRHMLAPQASVLRDGKRLSIAGDDVVPGDVVLLDAGDRVPADLRLFKVHGLQIQEAILTGESVAVSKQTSPVAAETLVAERDCMAFSGTTVTGGQGAGVVVATGQQTEVGRISGMLTEVDTLRTPLIEQMSVLARWLTLLIGVVAGLILLYGYFVLQQPFADVFMAVVGLSVAAIPEGLPAVLTITLAVGVQTMARRHAIVRRLPAIETVGSVSVICTDKTGTLTRNEMSVISVVAGARSYTVEDSGYAPFGCVWLDGETLDPEQVPLPLKTLVRSAVLCNDAELSRQGQAWEVQGDPMEGALLALAGKLDETPAELRRAWPRTDVIPFDTANRFMATLNHDHQGHGMIFVKGAPETVLALCANQQGKDGRPVPLDTAFWQRRAEEIASRGQRVLAFACREVPDNKTVVNLEDVRHELLFVGIVGLMDPPREEAINAVAECQAAGIRVKMITGDHANTASAIGALIGLANHDGTLTGAELDKLNDDELAVAARQVSVFARTSPEHKLRLVKALQSEGMTVAMTGDGVNDAPALRRADIGIAMGCKGTEAAKEVSDLVLADDNFASIVAAVREGRTVRDNIRKVIAWTLPTSSGEAFAIIVALLVGVALPVTPVQILWINFITTVSLGLALAFEPTSDNTMQRKPRPRTDPLIDASVLWHIILVSLLFLCGVFGIFTFAIESGYTLELARTMAMNTLVAMEIFYLFFIRTMDVRSPSWTMLQGTPVVWLAVFGVLIGQCVITYWPGAQAVFSTRAMSVMDLALVLLVGVALLLLLEVEKQVRMRVGRSDLQ